MTVAKFEELCRTLCEAAGKPAAPLTHGPAGITSLTMQVGGFDVVLARVPQHDAMDGLVLLDMGMVPPDIELPALLSLLDANLLMRSTFPTSLGCSGSGDVVLQTTFAVDQVSGAQLYLHVNEMADFVDDWKTDFFVDRAGQSIARASRFTL